MADSLEQIMNKVQKGAPLISSDQFQVGDIATFDGRSLAPSAGGIVLKGSLVYNVKDYGATGDGTTDDTTAIQATITAAGIGGHILFPSHAQTAYYKISSSLVPLEGQHWTGVGRQIRDTSPYPSTQIRASSTFNGALVSASATDCVTISSLAFRGNNASGSIGLDVTSSTNWLLENLFYSNFGDQAILFGSGSGYHTLLNIFAQGGLLVRTGRSDYVGVIEMGSHDAHMYNVWATASFPNTLGGYLSGWICGILIKGGTASMTNCGGHFSENGIALVGSGRHRLISCRGEFNQGPGYLISDTRSQIIGCWAYENSRTADNAHPAFSITSGQNTFAFNNIDGPDDAINHSNGFDDTCDDDSSNPDAGNEYYGNRIIHDAVNGSLYNITGVAQHGHSELYGKTFRTGGSFARGYKALTYSASITPDASAAGYFTISAPSAGSSFTINNPTMPLLGQTITFDITNSTGGAMGTLSWGAAYLLSRAFVNPASTDRSTISFYYDGTNWVETNRSTKHLPGEELLTATSTTADTSVSTTSSSAATSICGPTSAYTFDGATSVYVEVWAPGWTLGTTFTYCEIWMDSTAQGVCSYTHVFTEMFARSKKITPAAGSHTFTAKAWVDAGTGHIYAGTGAAGARDPIQMRVICA